MKWTSILLVLMLAAKVSGETNSVTIEQHMRQVIIPSIEFRQANPSDVLNFLIEASIASDPEKTNSLDHHERATLRNQLHLSVGGRINHPPQPFNT